MEMPTRYFWKNIYQVFNKKEDFNFLTENKFHYRLSFHSPFLINFK